MPESSILTHRPQSDTFAPGPGAAAAAAAEPPAYSGTDPEQSALVHSAFGVQRAACSVQRAACSVQGLGFS
jgi:hypothetical protein